MNRLGLEQLSVLGMPPVDFVHFAADLGCAHISLALSRRDFNPYNYPAWSLSDPALRKDLKAALKDRGVSVSLGEGLIIAPNASVRGQQANLDIYCELGAPVLNLYSLEHDISRMRDEAAIFAEMADARGLKVAFEFSPINPQRNVQMALETVKHTGRTNCGLLIDSMHFFRSGGSIADLKNIDPALILYIQICDAPLNTRGDYMQEAISNRLAPGDGELPLQEFLDALPKHLVAGLEMPIAQRAIAGENPRDYLGRALERTRALLDACET